MILRDELNYWEDEKFLFLSWERNKVDFIEYVIVDTFEHWNNVCVFI